MKRIKELWVWHIKDVVIKILWYYLALLTWIFEIILFASVIFIPIVVLLRYEFGWFSYPFYQAWINS